MTLYVLAALIGGIVTKIFLPNVVTSPFFEDVVMKNLRDGKRVAICVDEDATIFEMIQNRIRITRGKSDFFKETYDDVVASSITTESGSSDQVVS